MKDFNRHLQQCLGNILRFSTEIFKFTPSKQQEDLMRLVQYETYAPLENIKKGIFISSGQGTGKTAATCICAVWRCLQVRNSMVLVTAPTARQVQDVWIGELRRRLSETTYDFSSKFDVQIKKVTIEGVEGWGIRTATGNKEENVQGYHENNMTLIVEEASGIPRKIWRPLKGTMTQPNNLLIAIGNPNDRNTEFFDGFYKDAHLYHTRFWNAEDSPNVDKTHIQRMEAEYGRDSDVFRVRVLGQFPLEAPNIVIRYEDLLYAMRHNTFANCFLTTQPREERSTKQIGIDFARFGSDESVVCARFNSAMVALRFFSKKEPSDVVSFAFQLQKELGWSDEETIYVADAGGMGQGVMHIFYECRKKIFEFNSNGTPFESLAFKNAISEAYFHMRDITRRRLIHLKEDQMMFAQLVNRLYFYRDGLIEIEDKDSYMDRVGTEEYTSPDRAEAVCMAFYPYAGGCLTTDRRTA